MTISELISALKFIDDFNPLEPEIFINVNNNLAVRYKNGENSYGVWEIDLKNHAFLTNIE